MSNPVVFDAMYDDVIERIKLQEQFATEHSSNNEGEKEVQEVDEEEEKRRLFELNKILPPENETK